MSAESQAPVLWDVCIYNDDRKQRTEVNISLPGAAKNSGWYQYSWMHCSNAEQQIKEK